MKNPYITTLVILSFGVQSCSSSDNNSSELSNSQQLDSVNINLDSLSENQSFDTGNTNEELHQCSCNVISYILNCPKNGIKLFDEANNPTESIFFNQKNEEFLTVEIKTFKNDKVNLHSLKNSFDPNSKNEYSNIWVEAKHLQIFLPDSKTKVNLYNEPNENAQIVHQINPFEIDTIELKNCCENWVYCLFIDENGQKLKGWLHPDDFCSNPLTNC